MMTFYSFEELPQRIMEEVEEREKKTKAWKDYVDDYRDEVTEDKLGEELGDIEYNYPIITIVDPTISFGGDIETLECITHLEYNMVSEKVTIEMSFNELSTNAFDTIRDIKFKMRNLVRSIMQEVNTMYPDFNQFAERYTFNENGEKVEIKLLTD